MTYRISASPHSKLPPALRVEIQKLLGRDEFLVDICHVFERFRMAYAEASQYDLLAAKHAKKTAKTVIKLTKRILELKADLSARLVAGRTSRAGRIFANTAEYQHYLLQLQPLMAPDFDQAAGLFCSATEDALRAVPKNAVNAIAIARQKDLLVPLATIFRKHGLDCDMYFKNHFRQPSAFLRIAASCARAAGDRGATSRVLGKAR